MAAKKQPKKQLPKNWFFKVQTFINSAIFSKLYLAFSLLIVLTTSLYWSLLGARIQLGNADQLVSTDLFKNLATFRGATFPGSHTFLIKWPIFWLINIFGSTNTAIEVFTVGLVLLTITALLAIIYRLQKRPLVFGTICLALASVLLLIPIEPYAGALLPVNMAMLTTRNIEYIVFIVSLVLLIRSPRIKSWGFWTTAIVLSLLFASDKLFLFFAIGSALIALIIYARDKTWPLVSQTVNWFLVSVAAAVGAITILAIISGSGLTHLSSQTSIGPYNLSGSLKQFAIGGIFAVMGVLTNFGANPAFDATKIRAIPHQFWTRLFSLSGPAYAINLVLLLIGLYAVCKVIRASWATHKNKKGLTPDKPAMLAILLIWSSAAAVLSFVATNHYYAVDARYLTIVFFAVFITLAVFTRTKQWRPETLVAAGLLIVIGIAFGLVGVNRNYTADKLALAPQNNRNTAVAQALAQHHTAVLVGDYWRVVPIKQVASNLNIGSSNPSLKMKSLSAAKATKTLDVIPLSNCVQTQQTLNSSSWQPNLSHTRFAYLLTLQGSLTNYPNCSLPQVVTAYGKPNASSLIAGSLAKPSEVLLFYDRGTHKTTPSSAQSPSSPTTILPISLNELPDTVCFVPSIMNIVAHEDDDLLFMNPDLIRNIQAGYCIRTIYITAGNAGEGQFYWLSREQGSEAAYDVMLGSKTIWIQTTVELSSHEFISVATPKDNPKISLIFMQLPDGNLKGQGFSSSDYESLAKLESGKISEISSVDNQSYYTSSQLTSALSALMETYGATEINTQSDFVGTQFPDHSDHLTVGKYVKQAYQQYESQKYANQVIIPIRFYIGYPVHQMPPNVTGAGLREKEAAFLAYAQFDGSTCQTLQQCLQTPTYDAYLTRQYQRTY